MNAYVTEPSKCHADVVNVKLQLDRITSPIGTILAVTDDVSLRALDFEDYTSRMLRLLRMHYGDVELHERRESLGVRERLGRYFRGELDAFGGVITRTNGSPFATSVWNALCAIPPGTTTTYGAIARSLGVPGAARAIGLANGANPIAIVVPCHRVIGADGTLTGYGGGLERKRWLLRHEAAAMHVTSTQCAFDFARL
ncbi:MAG: methylated-DNA--[protein]-cysteine S-methyltransferase [Vulcanimicrobiaceae bacterium]